MRNRGEKTVREKEMEREKEGRGDGRRRDRLGKGRRGREGPDDGLAWVERGGGELEMVLRVVWWLDNW